jgi:hypothetical protein
MAIYGALAEFATPADVHHACEKVRDAGFRVWDAHTPFPVHGLDRAMGLRRSILPWIVLAFGLTGVSAALLMQWWMSAVDYKVIIAAKPLFSWQAFVPVCFEVMVLFSAASAVFGMFFLCRLPMLYHPLFRSKRFERVSDDRFFISIEAKDPRFSPDETPRFLSSLGATHVELLDD